MSGEKAINHHFYLDDISLDDIIYFLFLIFEQRLLMNMFYKYTRESCNAAFIGRDSGQKACTLLVIRTTIAELSLLIMTPTLSSK